MKKLPYFALDYYDREVISRIIEKHGMDPEEAMRSFLLSETHMLLEDAENSLWLWPAHGVFDMWEAEMSTGDPRNSMALRGE